MNTHDLIGHFERVANALLNSIVRPIMASPMTPVLQPFIVTITYIGRRSGNTISTPVLYRKRGDRVTIWVLSPDSKTWWRNFLDDGAPITLNLPSGARTGHAVVSRDDRGKVTVQVDLNPNAG
jgi:hypothetical protein